MIEINGLIDVSTWTGNWPFVRLRYRDMGLLEEKLKALKVIKAFIAPIEGILEQDPLRANVELLKKIKSNFFSPVMVVDLSYENWQDSMKLALSDARVSMVKLIPNYHMYRMYDKDMGKLVELAKRKDMVISIQMGIEDARAQYPMMKVANVEIDDVIKTLSGFPEQTFILNNVMLPGVRRLMESLGNIYIDIACLECQDILERLQKEYTLERFLFASHCPFFFPEANVYKLGYSSLEKKEIDRVAYMNAGKIFSGFSLQGEK